MALGDFRSIYLPYCLALQEDGSYAVLNREYKPVGFNTSDYVTYSEYPVTTKFKGIGPSTAKKLSYNGNEDVARIYLYDDGSAPTVTSANMATYLKKIETLAKLQVKT